MKKFLFFLVMSYISILGQSSLDEIGGDRIMNHLKQAVLNADSSYIPLQTGNIYQYIEGSYFSGVVSYYLRYGTVLGDTLINNQKYFNYSYDNSNHLFKYSKEDNKLYKWINDEDRIYMDFNKEPGDTFMHYNYSFPARALGGDTTIFSLIRNYKGYIVGTGPGSTKIEHFARGLGIIGTKYEHQGTGHSQLGISLIMAILYDSAGNAQNFTNHYKPEISITPITLIDSSKFKLTVGVTHEYNRIVPPGPFPGGTSLYFISSVKLDSYYAKEDSIIELPLINAGEVINLDTILMKNGFTFNYRIIAKDKGIIPETSYAPDTGYYKCIWNGPTGIDDNTQYPQTFSLSQNYPNPFNPSTKISWQSPVGSHQTLKVYDVLGREVATLVDEYKDAGSHEVEFQSTVGNRQLASGVYYYQLKVGEFVETMKMILMK